MKIYIDFDDVICETAFFFTQIAKELFGIEVPYEKVIYFNLQRSFGLTDKQYDELMKTGHFPENLLSYKETNNASKMINKWIDDGHEINIITGRPYDSYEPSRQWLDEHNLIKVPLFCVDKYGREIFNQNASYSMTLDQLYNMSFDFAIEDSPAAFEHLLHFNNCKVAVYNRPWNKQSALPNNNFIRCNNWIEIDHLLNKLI